MVQRTAPLKTYRIIILTRLDRSHTPEKKTRTYYSYARYKQNWALHKKYALYFSSQPFPLITEMIGTLCNTGKCLNKFQC